MSYIRKIQNVNQNENKLERYFEFSPLINNIAMPTADCWFL